MEEMDEHMRNCSTDAQANENALALIRNSEIEHDLIKNRLQERIESLENQRASDGTRIDSLRAECNQLHDLICKLALAANLEDAVNEMAVDVLGETLIARITQLRNGDTEKQAKQRLQITRLQRDLRGSKERVDSLELQLSIMRRRLIEMQENRMNETTPASQTPATLAASEKERRRLAKQLQQTKDDMRNLQEEIVMLKSRLLESTREKLTNIGQSKTLRNSEQRISELKQACEVKTEEARKARTDLEHIRKRCTVEVSKMEEACMELENELRNTRQALGASRRSEEQLLDFRSMVARHLGLDNEHLSVPDYEILVHLDRLVAANQAHIASVIATERALSMVQGNPR
ncbi:Coiled-coil domain-containing protein [Fasciola gigantica]|uniref:Coiled-coil domain-containing protein n=1 Tax=Fasciola gigantica TaxID=46835 RepID=A0A504Y5L6_FASGI|nr:Coiled-coil domain-containing protein [Fasciola gigantica]